MDIFFGYFVWGLILAAPLWWLAWRLRLGRFVPDWAKPARQRPLELPPQLGALVIRGKRRKEVAMRRPSAVPASAASSTKSVTPAVSASSGPSAPLAEPRS
ncbi:MULTISPECIES: hypothetical protein [Paraburkholderia]|uniref:Cellulose biosynthesis protein BcsF n=1 Tax=Paraburkholderia tropica TaxID=92647 RepID=A0ABX5MY46_9BURK|nr:MULTISPECIES: hypothetical protein [Paraburkholderia]MBB3002435.1 hypothetical protein [Paraburkholderia tropica]MBB6321823.1 hypothetical protein [Paraburkholderia tropica]MDE1140326.1 hypothetical protein [Paraburkholderia tropica]PXX18254.1 hypothetical protein C7400_105316 [Paraburkholderia tropica]PZW86236.1 hypothetical protein C7399_105316 [Paraburkholderia tropica]